MKIKVWLFVVLICSLFVAEGSRSSQADSIYLPPPPPFPEGAGELTAVLPDLPAGTLAALDKFIYLPLITQPTPPALWVDTQNRQVVVDYYQTVYLASDGVEHGWTGNVNNCVAGSTTAVFKDAILQRINYFRGMAGVPAIEGFLDEYNNKAQAAALMMSAQGALSHSPDTSWACYTAEGKQGAGSSNLYLGVYGPSAISGYIYDPGGGNYFVGHRRWILYPQSKNLGTGDIPPTSGHSPANALWVFDSSNMWGARPTTREAYVAWPPPGYVPYQVIYPRWSFAYAGADFSGASVAMTKNGAALGVTLQPVVDGYGENTLVWEPNDTFTSAPASDVTYHVTINNVIISGSPQTFDYDVIMITP